MAKARTRVLAALNETPWDWSVYEQLGRIDQTQDHLPEAREEFAAAARLKKADPATIRQLSALAEAAHNHQKDRVQLIRTHMLSAAGAQPEICDSVGALLGRAELYTEALEPLQRSVELAPNCYQCNYDLGLIFFRLERVTEAETRLKKALSLQPESLQANSLLGLIYVEQNRNADAIERLRAASQAASGEDPHILALLGQQYLSGHYAPDAVACLTKAIERDPGTPALRYLLIEAYQEQHDFPSALLAAQNGATRFPADARMVYEVGQQLASIGKYQEAQAYGEKAVQLDANLVEAYDLLGDIFSRSGKYETSLANFQKARSIADDDQQALKGIAENLIRLQRYSEALDELQQAITVRPQDGDLYFNLMQVYVRLGKQEEAVQARAMFQKLRDRETAERNAQAPRSYNASPATDPAN